MALELSDDLYIEPVIQDYLDFLNDSDIIGKSVLTPQKIMKNFEPLGNCLNYFLAYPDLLVDLITPVESTFKLYFYQRIILRSMARHRQSYTVATRGASKSFNASLSRYLMAMCVPGHRTFVCTEIKEQAVAIAQQTIEDDLWQRFPLLKNEMVKIPQPGKPPRAPFTSGKGYATYEFSNGSLYDVISVDTARGKRRHSGIIEELIEQNSVKINEKVIPVMNVGRQNKRGNFVDTEPHAQKIYVTTAGQQGTFAYDKFLETLCMTAIDPDNFMALSMTYRIPMYHGLIQEMTIRELRSSPSFSDEGFAREYESKWSGSMKGAAFDYATLMKVRKINRAEYQASSSLGADEFYVISADMAKDGSANTAVVVLRVKPREFSYLYQQVNAFKIESTDYEVVSAELKKAIVAFQPKLLIYDANGIGASIRDWLNKDQRLPSGEILNGYGIINPPETSKKDIIKRSAADTICYEIKATGEMNSKINHLFFGRLKSGSVKMLVPVNEILSKLKNTKNFMMANHQKQIDILKPYRYTDIIQEELLNLDVIEISDGGTNALRVRRRNNLIQKDFFSAFAYAVYACNIKYELAYYKKNKTNRGVRATDFFKMTG